MLEDRGSRDFRREAVSGMAAAGAALALLTAPSLASAHHSFAMFDQTRVLSMQAVVVEFQWTNPHIYLVVRGSDGKDPPKRYVLEGSSVNMLSRNGWRRGTVKAGDSVTVNYHPLRNGEAGGALKSVQLPSGRLLKTW